MAAYFPGALSRSVDCHRVNPMFRAHLLLRHAYSDKHIILAWRCASQSHILWCSRPSLSRCKHLSFLTQSMYCCFSCVQAPRSTHAKAMCMCFCVHSSSAFLVGTAPVGSGHNPSFISVNSRFHALTLLNFPFDHMIIIFFTSSRHVSLKFMFLLSGVTITSHLGHSVSASSSCNMIEPPLVLCIPSNMFFSSVCTSTRFPSLPHVL